MKRATSVHLSDNRHAIVEQSHACMAPYHPNIRSDRRGDNTAFTIVEDAHHHVANKRCTMAIARITNIVSNSEGSFVRRGVMA
jgi:hypothetical protein